LVKRDVHRLSSVIKKWFTVGVIRGYRGNATIKTKYLNENKNAIGGNSLNWFERFPDISLKTLALLFSALDYREIKEGRLQLALNEDHLNELLMPIMRSSEYVEQAYVCMLGDKRFKAEVFFKVKGFRFRTAYVIEIVSFEFTPRQHYIVLKVSRQERHGKLAEGLYELTLEPYLVNRLRSYGIRVNTPYLAIDLTQNRNFQRFKSSFIGTVLLAHLVVTLAESSQESLIFDLDLSSLKASLPMIKQAVESSLITSLTGDLQETDNNKATNDVKQKGKETA